MLLRSVAEMLLVGFFRLGFVSLYRSDKTESIEEIRKKIIVKIVKNIAKLIFGAGLAAAGLAITLLTLLFAILIPGIGFLTQTGFSIMMYGLFVTGSIFNNQIQVDMNEIRWNPFINNELLLTGTSNNRKISFFKGIPVFWTNQRNGRSGSFLAIWLTGNNTSDTIKHEWGHIVQQGIMGPLKYAFMIGLPSWQQWGPSHRDYYNRPWEINADLLGGVVRPTHTQADITRGWKYLWVSTLFGVIGYIFVPF